MAALVFLLTTLSHAQDSHFHFDVNGNLEAQSSEFNVAPQIIGQPQNQVVDTGETASFMVVATGTKPLSYQWRFNNATLIGKTSEALLLLDVSTNNEGQYSVVVANAFGSVTSTPALLMIDTDHDGMSDAWELTYFGDLERNGATDFDGDHNSNLREFQDGTDPTDPNSVAYRLTVVRDLGSVLRTPDLPSYTNGQSVTLTAIPPTNGIFHAWLGDLLTRSNPVTVVMTRDKTVYARFTPIVFTWTNTVSGDWNTASNWKPNLAPSTNDTAIINTSVTVTLNTPADCAEVTLGDADSNPTLTGSGTLTVRGKFAWGSGIMSGTGKTIVETGATLNLVNPATVAQVGRTLENGGMAFLTDAGGIVMQSGAVITNRAGALFDCQTGATFSSTTSGRFDNAGTFRRSFGIGATTFGNGVNFNNYGAVELQTGSLTFGGGGFANGTFTNPASLLIEWTGGGFTLNTGAQLNGAGLYRISDNGTVAANASLNVQNLELVSVGATLGGTGIVSVLNAMNWNAGSLSESGRLIILPGAVLQIANSGVVFLNTHTLDNGGTVIWTGLGSFVMNSSAVLTNRTGALFDVQTASDIGASLGSGRIENSGTFRKSVSTGAANIFSGVTFNNSGAVEIQAGTLNFGGGGTHAASSSITGAGHLTFSGGGTVNLAGLVNVTGTNTITGVNSFIPDTVNVTGNYICTNNTLAISGTRVANFSGTGSVSPAVLELKEVATITGTSTVTVLSLMNWTGGNMTGNGRTVIPPGATLNVAIASSASLGRPLENGGTILLTGGGFLPVGGGAVITNRAGALFHVQNFPGIGGASANGRLDNAGTFRKSIDVGTTTFANGMAFNNFGTVEIQTGTLSLSGGGTHSGNFNVPAGTTLILSGGTHNAGISSTITGAGHFTVNGGIANLAGLVNISGSNTFAGFNSFIPDSANITGNYICTNNTLSISGNRVANFSGTGLVAPAVLNLTESGTLTGTNTVTAVNVMNWTGGTMTGSGRTLIPSGVTLNAAAPSSLDLAGRTLENGGTILWTGPGFISVRSGGVITNRVGALFHTQNAVSIGGGLANGRFDNAGTFRKSANAGATTFASGVSLNNYGTVDLRSGILATQGAYTSTSNALLNCAIGGTTAGTGFGQLQVVGTVTLNGALGVDLINGFVPATNDVFAVLTAGARNGTFASFSYPSNAVAMQLSNAPNSAIVRITGVFVAPQPAPIPAGLISWWRAEGNPLDSFGTNHGVLTNGIAFAEGKVGQAFALDGVNDYMQVPDSASLRPGSVTIEAWMKFFATNGIRIGLVKPLGSGTFDSYGLAHQDGAMLAAICDNAGFGPFLTGPANTVTGQWYHVAYTFDDSSKQQVLYLNGIPVASGTANKAMSYDTHPVLLGADLENGVLSFFHSGLIDEASLYNHALLRDEIATIYNAGAAGKLFLTPYQLWKQTYLGDSNASDTADPDGDGFNNLSEFTADTNPTNGLSNLRITAVTPVPAGYALQWQGGTLATQFLQRSFSLAPNSWQDVFTNPPPTTSPFRFTNSAGTSEGQFYRIRVAR